MKTKQNNLGPIFRFLKNMNIIIFSNPYLFYYIKFYFNPNFEKVKQINYLIISVYNNITAYHFKKNQIILTTDI